MDRRIFAVLAIIGILLTATVSSAVLFYSPFFDGGSSSTLISATHIPEGVDANGNKIEDLLEQEIEQKKAEGNGTELVNIVVLLDVKPSSAHTSVFNGAGGVGVGKTWEHALRGFAGRIPYIAVSNFASRCPNLLLVQKDHDYEVLMAYAAQQGRARPYVWDVLGYRGDPQSSIAISDSGIDDSHVNHGSYGDADFSKKIVGWRDDVGTGTTPYDDNGHGSHCAGIAAGSGFYSSDVDGRAVTTWSGQLEDLSPLYIYLITGFYVTDSGSGQKITLQAMGNGVDTLVLYYSGSSGDPHQEQVAAYSIPRKNREYTFEYNIPEGKIGYYHLWVNGVGDPYLRTTIHWPYDVPEDGYSAWTGVAPDAKLVGLKGLSSGGGGYTSDLVSGIDWAVANRETYHIMVLSISWGGGVYDAAIDTAVSTAFGSGIVCVTSAGNSGSGGNLIHSPSSNPYAISVAATSVLDSVTDYSSQGGPSEVVSSVVKPDVAAPGGSFFYVPILSTDSNDQDADDYYSDFYADDSAPMQGTSMSAPFIAGSAAVVAQALGGYSGWSFSDDAMALQTKMLLLMTATETYPYIREGGSASVSPTLDRGGKDVHEGYGRVNLDAAVEAAALTYTIGNFATESFGASPVDRKCWARNVYLSQGVEYSFDLTVPSGADYDLYLYDTTGDEYGEPIILTQSTADAVGGVEELNYTPDLSGSYYIVVKRAREDTGTGQFSLTSSQSQIAGTVHLLLSLDPNLATYSGQQLVTFSVTVFNQLNPPLDSTLTLTVTGPEGYYLYDFQPIEVEANEVKDYSFSWVVPDVAGRYVVEVGLVPAQLTAYDAAWLEVGVATAYFAPSEFSESAERWVDAANQLYSTDFQNSYDYSQASVRVQYSVVGETLTGTLMAQNLKPNFAYQLKLVGTPGVDSNERIGLAGRWWEQVWTGSSWSVGSNLNNKGDGSSPNPNDVTYFSRRDVLDGSSDTGYHYKYTGYLLFAYFITDENGDATVSFETGNSCHVLWDTDDRTRVADDGPLETATFDPDGTEPAYDVDYSSQTVSIFGEWERLPMGDVDLAAGNYDCQMVLTEESFHGSGFPYGNWATVMTTSMSFSIS